MVQIGLAVMGRVQWWKPWQTTKKGMPYMLEIALDDLQHHIVKYGVDCFPPLDVRGEIARAHDLFARLQIEWPKLYQEIVFRPESREFKILASFSNEKGTARMPTFELTRRGPVFIFPRQLPALGLLNHDVNLEDVFLKSLHLTRKEFPETQVLRVGLIRELVFSTGERDVIPYLSSRFGKFPGSTERGGSATLSFRDDKCNIRVQLETVEIQTQSETPLGQVVDQPREYGLKVEFDVNNSAVRPQEASDIETTLQRARNLWPDELLRFINWPGNEQ